MCFRRRTDRHARNALTSAHAGGVRLVVCDTFVVVAVVCHKVAIVPAPPCFRSLTRTRAGELFCFRVSEHYWRAVFCFRVSEHLRAVLFSSVWTFASCV
jgi:hypothetical protein